MLASPSMECKMPTQPPVPASCLLHQQGANAKGLPISPSATAKYRKSTAMADFATSSSSKTPHLQLCLQPPPPTLVASLFLINLNHPSILPRFALVHELQLKPKPSLAVHHPQRSGNETTSRRSVHHQPRKSLQVVKHPKLWPKRNHGITEVSLLQMMYVLHQ